MTEGTDFEIGKKLPYYIFIIFLLSGFFFLMAILANGIVTNYYKSNYGTEAITFEETIFSCITHIDSIIEYQNRRMIDLEKFRSVDLNGCVPSLTRDRQAKVELYLGDDLLSKKETAQFVRETYVKRYPVMIINEGELFTAELQLYIWRP